MCIYYIVQLVKKKKAEKDGAGYPQDGAPVSFFLPNS
jgi:hypothetical protein